MTGARPLSIDITKSRWRIFGHALRLNENTPAARKAMKWFFQVPEGCRKFRGRKRATIEEGDNFYNVKQRHTTHTTDEQKLYFAIDELRVGPEKYPSKSPKQKAVARICKNGD